VVSTVRVFPGGLEPEPLGPWRRSRDALLRSDHRTDEDVQGSWFIALDDAGILFTEDEAANLASSIGS
jgi:hypothetical protein